MMSINPLSLILKLSFCLSFPLYAKVLLDAEKLPEAAKKAPPMFRKLVETYPKLMTRSGEIQERHVIYLPKRENEQEFRVELFFGINHKKGHERYVLNLKVAECTCETFGAGYPFYRVVHSVSFVLLNGNQQEYIDNFLVATRKEALYNSSKPLVVYLEPGIKLKYRIKEAKRLSVVTKAAEEGNAEAQYALGRMYEFGNHTLEDTVKASRWYLKSATQGYAKAQHRVGLSYYQYNSTPTDIQMAKQWFTKAAEQGNPGAHYSLGQMYISGKGVKRDVKKAFAYINKAAEGGVEPAQTKLGEMYYKGQGTAKNIEKAAHWITKAKNSGHYPAWQLWDRLKLNEKDTAK